MTEEAQQRALKEHTRERLCRGSVRASGAPTGWSSALFPPLPPLLPQPLTGSSSSADLVHLPLGALCRVSDGPFDPEEGANIPTVSYELPDGQVRHACCAALCCFVPWRAVLPPVFL